MSEIVFAHGCGNGYGYGVSGGEHWYSSAGEEFADEGHEVRIPNFPEPFAPEADVWPKASGAEAETERVAAVGTVPAGHGRGGARVLRLPRERDTGAEGAFAGVVFAASVPGDVGCGALAPFFTPEFGWRRIRGAARELGAGARLTASGGQFPRRGGSRRVVPDAVRLIREVL
nr:hypothetical protein OG409_27880 [Streptomyces sp. NBC_00974]